MTVRREKLLDRLAHAEARHGGREHWAAGRGLELRLRHFSGPIPWAKGLGRTFPPFDRATVWPRARRMVVREWPSPGQRGVYAAGDVTIGPPEGPPLVASPRHRRTFAGPAKARRWAPADALYFFGYAVCHYLSLPHCLRDDEIVDLRDAGDGWVVTARYDQGSDTHGHVQRFHFDAEGLLRRHDYRAYVLGPGAHGAHFSGDYVRVDGVEVATSRRVHFAPYGRVTPLVVLRATLEPLRWVDPP